jgi:hypothetical protein
MTTHFERGYVWVLEVKDTSKKDDLWEPCTFRCFETKSEAIACKKNEAEDSCSWYRWRIRKYVVEGPK